MPQLPAFNRSEINDILYVLNWTGQVGPGFDERHRMEPATMEEAVDFFASEQYLHFVDGEQVRLALESGIFTMHFLDGQWVLA